MSSGFAFSHTLNSFNFVKSRKVLQVCLPFTALFSFNNVKSHKRIKLIMATKAKTKVKDVAISPEVKALQVEMENASSGTTLYGKTLCLLATVIGDAIDSGIPLHRKDCKKDSDDSVFGKDFCSLHGSITSRCETLGKDRFRKGAKKSSQKAVFYSRLFSGACMKKTRTEAGKIKIDKRKATDEHGKANNTVREYFVATEIGKKNWVYTINTKAIIKAVADESLQITRENTFVLNPTVTVKKSGHRLAPKNFTSADTRRDGVKKINESIDKMEKEIEKIKGFRTSILAKLNKAQRTEAMKKVA